MKAKYGGKQGGFALELAKFAEQATEAIDASLREIIIEVAGSLIRMSPVDSGRFRGNWQFNLMTPDNSTSLNVDPTGAETLGRIVAEAGAFNAGQVAYITNSLPYAIPLEYGHSEKQAPQGMVRVTLARFQQIVDEAVRNHHI
ncbi:HK97 gp10 family phage protein [Pseudomonas sp. GL-RE-29]|uniref:HK97 gp10 family phage protein n=1 Tax=Pseudomonas sp. GL-RE-29 TaxID=2832375 RepID=UPI001CC00045|nr:HK97 gp10 family phage protein [Pseudomonas sp. GL-RE-29]